MKLSPQPSSDSHALKCELASEVLRSSGCLRLQVTGWSMLPTVWPGDTLTIERIPSAAVVEGDIVLFSRDRRLFTHRVIARGIVTQGVAAKGHPQDAAILTRGDAMPACDPPVPESDVLGRVSLILREGRCIEPSRSLGFRDRAVAALVQRSTLAARIVVGLHGLGQKPREQAPQV